MYDVVIYFSSLPKIADHNRKVQVLQAFAQGAQHMGAKVHIQKDHTPVDCRLAVILGWVGKKIRGPHIQLRQDVIDHQQRNNQHVMPIDGSCFKFVDVNSIFLRYSLDGVFYNTNNYANRGSTDEKWQQVRSRLNLTLEPWRQNGSHILVCLQRDGGWSMKGTDMDQWAHNIVVKLRSYTDRPIVVRPHPKHSIDFTELQKIPGVSQSQPGHSLQKDLAGAWAAVFYNSSSSVAAVLGGVPVFVSDDDCVAWSVANSDLARIETPVMPDRTQWLYDLSVAHWTDEESRSGDIYRHFLSWI
jgi:hypothetical protein